MIDPALRRTLWCFFLLHAALFVLVNGGFISLNLLVGASALWFFYPLFFWLLLLILHYAVNKLIISGFLQKCWSDFLDRLDQ